MSTPEELGTIGAYYFSREVDWLRRHVQHLSFPDPQTGWQQLTIDVVLPSEGGHINRYGRAAGGSVFCIPVARYAKDLAIHELDFVDERGSVLPLVTKSVSATISATALTKALLDAGVEEQDLTVGLPSSDGTGTVEEQQIIEQLTRRDRFAATFFRELAYELVAPVPDAQLRGRFHHLLEDLAENAYIWLVIGGEPGEQRTIKLSYGLDLPTMGTIHRKPGIPAIRAYDHQIAARMVIEGDIDVRKTGADLVRAFVAAFGMATRRFRIRALNVAHVQSYHLAFTAPFGVVVHAVSAEITREDGTAVTPTAISTGRQGTVYTDQGPLASGKATMALRPDLTGLGIATIYALATSLLLWVVHASAPVPSAANAAVAAVLLVIPTFLAVFARRRSEHVLVGSLLRGVRLLVFLVAASAIAAGAAVAGLHTLLSTRHLALVCAIAASAAAALLAFAWSRWVATAVRRWLKHARRRERHPG